MARALGLTRTARAAILAGLLATAGTAAAQEQFVGRPYRVADSGRPRSLADDYERYANDADWDRAVRALQEFLDLSPTRGSVLEMDRAAYPRFEGVARVGRQLFERLPEEGRRAWEETYRLDAEALLERALRLRREEDLVAAARRFPAHDVRRRAHEALAGLALGRGDFSAATHHLHELLAVAEGDEERASVLARVGFARAQAGDAEGVRRAGALGADILEVQVPGPEGSESLATFLERMAAAAGSEDGSLIGRPSFSGGRHGLSLSLAPPRPDAEKARWTIATLFQEGTETHDDRNFRFSVAPDRGERPVAPVVSRGIVYVNSGLSLRAVDLSSGHVIWQQNTRQRVPEWRDNHVALHTATVAGDTVFAALASRADAPDMDRVFYGRTIVHKLTHRSLAAYDARTGDVLWSNADEHQVGRPDAEELARESVASPPLVVGDDVLVAAWSFDSFFDVRLVCFDRRTGRTRWRRTVAQGQQELNLFGRPVKELVTTPLAELDGRIYFATGLGIAACVRIADGTVEWLSAYAQTPTPPSNYWYETVERPITWRPSTAAASRLGVILAPPESPFLVSFDPQDGSRNWSASHRQTPFDLDYFLGVAGERVVTMGDRVMAFDIRTGDRTWTGTEAGRITSEAGNEVRAYGRGVLTDDAVFVPTGADVVEIRLDDGTTGERWPLPNARGRAEASGDLVAADGALLVVNRTRIEAHYRAEERHARLLEQIAAAPNDPRLRLEAGEILRKSGRNDEAIAALESGMERLSGLAARSRERLEQALRTALFEALIARVAEARRAGDAAGAVRDLERAVDVAQDRGDAVRALFLLSETAPPAAARSALERVRDELGEVLVTLPGEGRLSAGAFATHLLAGRLVSAGDVARGVDMWLDLLETRGDEDLGRTDVRSAVTERLERTRIAHDAVVTERIRIRAMRAFVRARDARDPAALDRVARTYPDPRIRADAALLGAKLRLNHGQAREAVSGLRALLAAAPEASDEARALHALSEAYRTLGEPDAERMVLQRLLRDHAGVSVDGRTAGERATERLAAPELAAPAAGLPAPALPLGLLWESDPNQGVPTIVELAGRPSPALDGKVVAVRARVLEVLDGATGRPIWRTPTDLVWRLAASYGDSIVLVGDGIGAARSDVLVRAFSIADGSPLWTQRLAGGYRTSARGLGITYVVHARADARGGATHVLSAVDLSTGELLAAREFEHAIAPDVVVAEDAVLVFRAVDGGRSTGLEAVTLDGATLSLRGALVLDDVQTFDDIATHAPGTGVVAVMSDRRTLVGVDVTTGQERWRRGFDEQEMRAFHSVPGGFVVVDGRDHIVRIDAATGDTKWTRDVAGERAIGWLGFAVDDGLIVATVIAPGGLGDSTGVALDAETGDELWSANLPLLHGGRAQPLPVICRDHVAFEIQEKTRSGEYRARVFLIDRATGAAAATVEHPSIGRHFQRVIYDRDFIALARVGELAVYGTSK